MNIKVTYAPAKRGFDRKALVKAARWPFLAAAFACVVVNLAAGGPAWSIVALWGLWMLWTDAVSPDMIGYNRVSQCVKISVQVSVMLFLIEVCLASGWAFFVLPMVGVGSLITAASLFFSDLRRQTANVMPLLLLAAVLLGICTVGVWIWDTWPWPMIVMGAVSFAVVAACMATRGGALKRDLGKYFELK